MPSVKVNTVFKYALFMLLLSGIYGLLMRLSFVLPMPSLPFNNVLQGHSHVAFLGWGYLTTIGVVYLLFLSKKQKERKGYNYLMIGCALTIFLMLISFITGGYGVFSVVLLAVFGLGTYVLSFYLLRDIKGPSYAVKFLRFGIYYYLLSSLATWFLAGVILTVGKSDLYYNTVYFYLHFLYNGYFVFIIFAILIKLLELRSISFSRRYLKPFFIYLNVACIPTYALSVLWSDVHKTFYVIGFAGAILQMVALFFLVKLVGSIRSQLNWSPILRTLFYFGLLAFGLKIILQMLTSFQYFVTLSVALKPYFIVGYLHLFTLAYMSVFLLLILYQIRFLNLKVKFQLFGVLLFLIGVLGSEILLFTQGLMLVFKWNMIDNYYAILFGFSAVMTLGIVMIFVARKSQLPSSI
jgi:hypothetical protein